MDLDVLEFLFPADHLFTVVWNLSIWPWACSVHLACMAVALCSLDENAELFRTMRGDRRAEKKLLRILWLAQKWRFGPILATYSYGNVSKHSTRCERWEATLITTC